MKEKRAYRDWRDRHLQSLPRVRPRLATTAPEDLPDRAGHPQGRSEAEEARSGLTRLDGGGYPGGF